MEIEISYQASKSKFNFSSKLPWKITKKVVWVSVSSKENFLSYLRKKLIMYSVEQTDWFGLSAFSRDGDHFFEFQFSS